ncbi:MAG: NADPH-ferredoxin reductase [Mycobacterium sp.]|jgi:ferredoxin--NADP+ reductase|nr:NADPH-ferredoxin reductase [Mycobacterium sp.]
MTDQALRVAVIGSGPAGVYAAQALAAADGVGAVDVLDRLPAPYGLVRYGVAPDHLKIKSTMRALQGVLEHPAVRFLGNVELGRDVTVADLHDHYDAVIVACGAAVDRRLGVPGEELPGSFSATEFVSWYSGHPDAEVDRFALEATSVVVVGVGNVAVDVARLLAKTAEELRSTDLPDHVLDVLSASRVTDIHMLGRRGPAQATFTSKELTELGELANADVIVDPAELVLDEASEEAMAASPAVRRNVATLQQWAEREPAGRPRRLHLRFLTRPTALLGESRVEAVQVERTALDGTGRAGGTGELSEIPAQLVLRSVGYRGVPLPGLPFDEGSGTMPHEAGRVLNGGGPLPRTYVAGWIKRGPSGVIGTNKKDAVETVASLLADAPSLPRAPHRDPDAFPALLRERGVDLVEWDGWRRIDEAEVELGREAGRDRVKIHEREQMLRLSRGDA